MSTPNDSTLSDASSTPDSRVGSDGGFGGLRSRRELAQECANLANQVSNEGCSFADGTAFRGLIDEAAKHGAMRPPIPEEVAALLERWRKGEDMQDVMAHKLRHLAAGCATLRAQRDRLTDALCHLRDATSCTTGQYVIIDEALSDPNK